MNLLRHISLFRLLLLCAATVAVGVSATAIALALGGGPVPPQKPLAQAVHDALEGGRGGVPGFSASITLTNHLLEGANLASPSGQGGGGELTSSPLLTGGSGRIWVGRDGDARLELQSEGGDTEIVYDGHSVTLYDAANDTVYRYTPEHEAWTAHAPGGKRSASRSTDSAERAGGASETDVASPDHGEIPSVAEIEEAITHIRRHADLSEATPTDVGGQPAYTARLSPSEGGSLIGGAELSFDAANGVPLRAAVYSSTSSAPVIELAASDVSFGSVPDSVFRISPPPGAKVEELTAASGSQGKAAGDDGKHPTVTSHGHGITAIGVLEAKGGKSGSTSLEGLPKVEIKGTSASELRTALGTVLTFERAGTRYVVGGALAPGAIEALAGSL